MLEFWRFLRDVMIVIGVLLIVSGLAAAWGVFCLGVWLFSWLAAVVVDRKLPEKPTKRRPF